MLSLKNVRFEILRDPIVRDFSMDLQSGEVMNMKSLRWQKRSDFPLGI